jgi:hypothetical protein
VLISLVKKRALVDLAGAWPIREAGTVLASCLTGMGLDMRIAFIRKDPVVGRGTCSSTDECLSDAELTEQLDAAGIKDPRAAVAWARKGEELYLDKALDCRWGEDSDPQLASKREFDEACEQNPL